MTKQIAPLTERQAWKALEAHHKNIRELHLRKLFADDPKRGERMTAEAVGLYLDYSKNRVTDETLKLLVQLAEESGLRERIDAMFRGEKINITENRAVLHVALRAPRGASIVVDGENVVPQVHAVLDKMADFSNRVRSGALERSHRQTHSQRHQYRHRRLRPRAGDGVRGAEALQRAGDDVSFCFQRRRHRLRGSRPRSRPGGDSLHHFFENLHDPGDDDERPHRSRVVTRRSRRRRKVGRQAFCCGVDERG